MAKQPARGRETPSETENPVENGAKPDESTQVVLDVIPPEVHDTPEPAMPKAAASAQEVATSAEKIAEPAAQQPAPAPQPQRRSGFFPLVLGGIIAGAIGFAVASLTSVAPDNGMSDQIARQAAKITSLEQEIAAIPAPSPVDLSGIEAAQSALSADVADLRGQLNDAVAALNTQIANLPQIPVGDGAAPAITAYEAELDSLRAQLETMAGTAMAQIEDARAEAAAIEENAATAARTAAGRAALARIQTALESGAPFGAALADLEDAIAGPAPDALLAVQDGVPTLASLQAAFPDVARAALTTARAEGVAGEPSSGIGAFLRNQFEVRSVAPREGADADAILSRAEAAVSAGRLADALAEIAALPEVARAEMSDWLAAAEARASAVDAVDILATSLNDN
ncbi:hypothetical protein [Yoonia sp.]|uniref:hypothetical protein n=1 Tax=Yoonia sp. TaxID=2212373 RepID=UPI0025F9DA68|nr:hypothetical protein [Yoonia sp.]